MTINLSVKIRLHLNDKVRAWAGQADLLKANQAAWFSISLPGAHEYVI